MTDAVDEEGEEMEGSVFPQNPYNTRSAQHARKQDGSKVFLASQ